MQGFLRRGSDAESDGEDFSPGAYLSYTIDMVLDVFRKREHEAHVELDGGDMPDFSV